MGLVDVGTATSAAVPLHLLLVVNVGIRNAHALSTLYVLARGIDVYAEEITDKFFHVYKKLCLAYSLKDFRLPPFVLFILHLFLRDVETTETPINTAFLAVSFANLLNKVRNDH